MDDPPRISLPTFTNKGNDGKLPGVIFNADAQCQFVFGEEFRQCPFRRVSCEIILLLFYNKEILLSVLVVVIVAFVGIY